MIKLVILVIFFTLTDIVPTFAMSNEDDPRLLASYMDKSLSSELDILRVTAQTLPGKLVFQIKTRGEPVDGETGNYFLLQITNDKPYLFLVPVNNTSKDNILMYEGISQSEHIALAESVNTLKRMVLPPGFSMQRIHHGIEFSLPLDWIDFSSNLSYDAYTAHADTQESVLKINEIHDQAGKGRKNKKQYSAITLLNKLCATRRKAD